MKSCGDSFSDNHNFGRTRCHFYVVRICTLLLGKRANLGWDVDIVKLETVLRYSKGRGEFGFILGSQLRWWLLFFASLTHSFTGVKSERRCHNLNFLWRLTRNTSQPACCTPTAEKRFSITPWYSDQEPVLLRPGHRYNHRNRSCWAYNHRCNSSQRLVRSKETYSLGKIMIRRWNTGFQREYGEVLEFELQVGLTAAKTIKATESFYEDKEFRLSRNPNLTRHWNSGFRWTGQKFRIWHTTR